MARLGSARQGTRHDEAGAWFGPVRRGVERGQVWLRSARSGLAWNMVRQGPRVALHGVAWNVAWHGLAG